MIESILLQVAENISSTVIPISPEVVNTAPTSSIVNLFDSMIGQVIALLTIVSVILGSPGIIALANYFKKGKELQAGQEMLGILATQIQDIRKDMVKVSEFVYNVAPQETKDKINTVAPTLQDINSKLENLNDELGKLQPKLAPSTRAAMHKI